MSNQIAVNQRHHSDEQAAEDTARHIKRYWTPLMTRDLIAYADGGGADLDRLTLLAIGILKDQQPSGQSPPPAS